MNATAYRSERKSAACHVGALALAVLLAVMSGRAHAALYKWTDAHGEVHYSDKLPVEAVNGATTQLNRQGITVHKTEAARPIAQQPVARTESEEQKLREAERARVLAARRDRALIESYASEAEIDLAKSRAVATIDGQVRSAYAYLAQMTKRRQELEDKKPTYAPRPVPGSLVREIETIDAEMGRQNEFIAAKEREAANVAARYDADKQRFRELRAAASGSVATTDSRSASTSTVGITLTSAR
ncbi:MAG TPA: DUF4124 domain-containing protein [Casimicrobiaceae bacterium]|nr:DUF4124 domain-containing protein [Casimicrobiaceae bacterium]